MDVLFFAFANNPQQPLAHLMREADELYRLLSLGELRQQYILVVDRFTTREKIVRYLNQYKDHLALFHYSGHAGENILETVEEVSHSQGIAQMLGQCPKLQLAVLNGCSTQGQVEQLWEAEVPAIIATNSPVGDNKATNFSISFYQALSQQDHLQTAFEFGKGAVLSQEAGLQIELHRGFKKEQAIDEQAWGLYVQPQDEDVLNWQLPQKAAPLPLEDFEPNESLIDTLYDALAPYSREVRNLKRDEEDGEEVDMADKRLAILNSLPVPIAEQLRKLMVPLGDRGQGFDKISGARAKQLVQTYNTLIELLTYIMMAQLWEAKAADESFDISPSQKKDLQTFMALTPIERQSYSFLHLLKCIDHILEANNLTYFIEEWPKKQNIFAPQSEFSLACSYLMALKTRLGREELAPHEITESCRRAEKSLCELFQHLGFLAKYTLVAVRMIEFVKFRHHQTPRFRHSLVRLIKLMGGLEEKSEERENFLDSRSVLLLKKPKSKDDQNLDYLNLSPFVIDENAFDDKGTFVSKVHFFYHQKPKQSAYVFQHTYKPEDELLEISDEKYPIVKVQFEAFAELMFK